MKFSGKRPNPGMTLMEVVIALGVMAFVIPIVLTATGSANISRLSAEADTRSAWLAREVQREIITAWTVPAPTPASAFGAALAFPVFATPTAPEILAYDSDGNFLAKGTAADLTAASKIPKASYLVAVHGEVHRPPNLAAGPDTLSLLTIRVLHPAKAPAAKRSDLRYQIISPRQGTL
jgi:type II secretory pathway pseudopilin PulG